MSIRKLIELILINSPKNIHGIVEKYFGLFLLDGKECDIIYDSKGKCFKLHNLMTDEIGLLINDKPSNECKSFDTQNLLEINQPIIFFTRNELFTVITTLYSKQKKYDFITWLQQGKKFSIIRNSHENRNYILTDANVIQITLSDKLYEYNFPNIDENNIGPYTVYYDKSQNLIINEDKKHVAILLSIGWGAPKWATKSRENLFDIANIVNILPYTKIHEKKLIDYKKNSILRYLHLYWIPIDIPFIVYYLPDRGESYKLINTFEFTV